MSLASARIKDTIVEILIKNILEGNIEANRELKQEELAEKLQVSRIPVREALMVLQDYGLAERRSNRHTYVIKIDNNYLREVYDMIKVVMLQILENILKGEHKEKFLSEIKELKGEKKGRELALKFQIILEKNIYNLCLLNIFSKLNNSFFKYGLSLSNQENLKEYLEKILNNIEMENCYELKKSLEKYCHFILQEIMEKRREING